MNLTNKRILVVAPKYFGYEVILTNELIKHGANVHYIENKPFKYDPLNKGTGFFFSLFCKKNNYRQSIIDTTLNKSYDLCLFINLFSFHPKIISNLRKYNKSIQCILYLWDNLKGYRWKQFFGYFNKIYSFDPIESAQHKLHYLPNFYPNIKQPEIPKKNLYDFCFIGSFQVHRLKILEKLATSLNHAHKPFFFYLHISNQYNKFKYNKANYFLANLFPNRFHGFRKVYQLISGKIKHNLVQGSVLPLEKTVDILSVSKVIIDLPYQKQSGSTQRLTLGLGLNKKIITTNTSVIHDSFYSPDNIQIISPDSVEINWTWINDTNTIPSQIEDLRIDNWIQMLLSDIK